METRHFRMHQKLLLDVIQRQAGTLSKAILELVMNAVDAKATEVTIAVHKDSVLVKDDGTGFGSRENIVKFFECFGQPHEENEKKTYGTFRMGRGQALSYGVNDWKTGSLRMLVDIQNKGLTYDLLENQPEVAGCQVLIGLYQPIGLAGIADVRRDIENWCKWAPIKVQFNGEQVSGDPADAKWDTVTQEAFIRLKDGGTLDVFNLGIHVCSYPGHKFGCGGEVVTRKQLKVNFARNDIQSDCPVWRKIRPLVDARATEKNTGRTNLDDAGRQRLVDQLLNGEIGPDPAACRFKIFTLVTGRHVDAQQVMYPSAPCYSAARRGDKIGDMLLRRGVAFIFADETLDRWHVKTVPALLRKVKGLFSHGESTACSNPCQAFEALSAGFSDESALLQDSELTANERLWLAVISKAAMHLRVEDEVYVYGYSGRRLAIGISDASNAWTDGASYVAINRQLLAEQELDVEGLTTVGLVLLHEACHDEPDHTDHDHDQDFFERFHDAALRGVVGEFVKAAISHLPAAAEQLSKKLTKKQMQAVDKVEAGGAAAKRVKGQVGSSVTAAQAA